MKMSDMVIGVGLVILGILFLSENFGYLSFDFQNVWPVFVLLAGVGFWIGFYQDRKNYGLLMPGSILIIYGILFLYSSVEGWYLMSYWWPIFILGPGIGFFMMYIFGEKEKGMLIPASILTGISVLFLIGYSGIWRYWPVIMIVVGLVLIFRYQLNRDKKSEEGNEN